MKALNFHATHPLQSYEWGEFRKKTGVTLIRKKIFQLTIHKIPYTPWGIGYLPKGPQPTKTMLEELLKIGKDYNCIFIQLEPNVPLKRHYELVSKSSLNTKAKPNQVQLDMKNLGLRPSARPLFTKYTLILDLTKSDEELLKAMQPKTRYNIKVAQKHGVKIVEDNSDQAFDIYWKLTEETTKRQGFYAHTKKYHQLMWETLRNNAERLKISDKDRLTAHLLLAKFKNEVLAAWVLFVFKDTLYYPYGASSREHRDVMAQNLMMWEAIKLGKKLGLKKFDMWGSLGPNADPKDQWYGFHRFKIGYSPKLVEFVGSYDLVVNPLHYKLYVIADKCRWLLLKFIK